MVIAAFVNVIPLTLSPDSETYVYVSESGDKVRGITFTNAATRNSRTYK